MIASPLQLETPGRARTRENRPAKYAMQTLRLAILSFALLALCGQAFAQFGGTRRGGGDSSSSGRSRRDSGDLSGVTTLSANDQVRMQITHTRLALKLTPEQTPLFETYQAKVLALLDSGGATPASQDSAPQQIDLKVDATRHRVTALEDIAQAAKKLYEVLTEEQKKIADQMLPGTVP